MNESKNKWKEKLTPEEYRVMFEDGTEQPFSGEYWNNHEQGIYRCRACGQELFSSDTKFDSGTGWPSFTEPISLQNVELREDKDMTRTEVVCKNCGGHLGHVFDDGPKTTPAGSPARGKRYCINSLSLKKNP